MMPAELVGRDAALDDVVARSRRHRLVTIVGPGGVGKTTVARAAAERLAPQHPLGVREIDLARIDDESLVPGAFASQLGFDSFDALLSSPADRPVLLVVDNCEHVIDACAEAVARLLGACLQPVVIATSRAPLELPGESIVSLPPLSIPEPAGDPSTNASVELFLRRLSDAGAAIGPDELESVAELCRRLDGLPLAIEIAAARARTLSVAEIVERLDTTIEVLGRPRFRGEPRHRSIADTIGWSRDLLTPGQARLLERIAVFAGPFTVEDARAVAFESTDDVDSDLDADLEELVNSSLVVVDERTVPTRYRLLDTIRRFSLDRLRQQGDLDAAHDRFVDHVLTTVRRLVAGSGVTWRSSLVRDLQERYDDIAEALAHTIAHDPTPDRGYRLCGLMWAIVHQGHADDIARLCRRTLERWPADGSSAAAGAVASLATAEYVTGHPAVAAEIAASAIADVAPDSTAAVTLHRALGQSQRALGDLEAAVATFRAGAAIGHRLRMTAMALELDIAAAVVNADLGNVDDAVAELTSIVERSEATSAITHSWATAVLGWLLLRRDPADAIEPIERALDEARSIDYSIAVAVTLRALAYAHLLTGRIDRAAATIGELLDDLVARGALSNLRIVVDVTAAAAYRAGHPAWDSLAATARSLPITTLTAAHYDLVPLPDPACAPLHRTTVVAVIRQTVRDLAERVAEVADRRGAGPADVGPTDVGPASGSIQHLGDVCELTFAGRDVTVRTTKGLVDIAEIIRADGAEIHCLDLAGGVVDQPSTGETIDATARRQYENRIRDLQDDIEEAESNSDFERAYRYQTELDQLIDHLSAAIGRSNRTRRAADSTERARSAVTHRVRSTIRQLTKLHPELGAHLAHSINTGTYCSYRPERATSWVIR